MRYDNLIVDGFAGGGGTSFGFRDGFGRSVDIAINHDPDAILMHEQNHPDTLHLQDDIWNIDPLTVTKGRHVSLLWMSPDCTHFSKAKGDTPRNKNIRFLPFSIVLWARRVRPDVIMAENVEEIKTWGPLDKRGRPIKKRKGETFNLFIRKLRKLGYKVEWKELVAADYGAPTTRKRWYMIARCDGMPIVWPEPTHSKNGENGLLTWEPIHKYLDLSDLGSSIFSRKTPLKDKTLNRIALGIKKFVIDDPNRFILSDQLAAPSLIQYHSETLKGSVRGQSLNEPIQTIDTSNRYALITCFISKFYKTGIGQSINDPIHTITTSAGHFALVSAFLIKYYGHGIGQSLSDPIGTIVTKDRFGLVLVVINGETYQIVDICFRMLQPEEYKLGQGFSKDYIINFIMPNGKKYPKGKQVERIGNSVVPVMSKTLGLANCPYLKVGERTPDISIDYSNDQLKFA